MIKTKKTRKKCLVTLQRNKKPFFYFNKPCSLKSKKSHFLLFLVKTMPVFRLLRFGQKKTRNNA